MTQADVLTKAATLIEESIKAQFQLQGHHLSGSWEESINHKMIGNTEIEGTAYTYGSIVNAGTSADRIPYQEGSGAKESKYIAGLKRFWMAKGKSDKEATSLAFATAKVQKREGMPTAGSYLYTSTGYRTNFIGLVQDIIETEVDEMVSEGMDAYIKEQIEEPELITY